MYCLFSLIGQITLLDHLYLAANTSFFIYKIAGLLYSNNGTHYLLYFHITQQCHRQLPLIFQPPSKVTDIDPFNFHSTQLQSIVFPIFTPLSKITDNLLFDHPAMTQTITLWFSHSKATSDSQNCPWHLPVPHELDFPCSKSFIQKIFSLNWFCSTQYKHDCKMKMERSNIFLFSLRKTFIVIIISYPFIIE